MEDQAYLEPGFDPTSLTIPRLRSILVAHSVNYPSSAKKGDLINLFHANIGSQAAALRKASLRVKRTSRGIVDVPASQSTEHDEEELPPPPSTDRRSGGRSTRARTEEAQEVPSSTSRSTRHSTAPPEATPRRASSKHARTVEPTVMEEPEPKRPSSRRSQASAQTPRVKTEDADDLSPFSSENVFQSGSSPPPAADRRRTTMSVTKDLERRRSEKIRRRTEYASVVKQQTDGAIVPTRRTFEMPVSAMKKESVQPTEEFTPEEEEELALAQQSGELVPVRRKRTAPAAKAARNGFSAICIAVLAASAYLWGDEKFKVGYCGHGEPSSEIAGVEIPEWADSYRPLCEPCPPHAICYDRLQTACEPGFVLTQNPLSLNGVVPIPPTCEPDTAKTKKVNAVKERVVEELREQNAKYECGDAPTPEVQETVLKQEISIKRRKGMSNQEFEELWDAAIGEVRDADEVSQGSDGSGHPTLRSNSLRNLSLACSIRRSLRETLREYFWALVSIAFIASGGLYGQQRLKFRRETDSIAKQITGQVYQLLSSQASLHAAEPGVYRENYVPMAQLRDDVLRNEYSTWKRKAIWEKVQRRVERNSNVRPMVKEGRSGDVGRVWEWVGAVGMIESPASAGTSSNHQRRKSGRVSFGGEQWIEPRSEEPSEMSEVGRWQEGRQYY